MFDDYLVAESFSIGLRDTRSLFNFMCNFLCQYQNGAMRRS